MTLYCLFDGKIFDSETLFEKENIEEINGDFKNPFGFFDTPNDDFTPEETDNYFVTTKNDFSQTKEKDEKNKNQDKSDSSTQTSIKKLSKIDKKIFKITKENKKKGRVSKKRALILKNSKKHDKTFRDNIIRKIKSHFISKVIKFINLKYFESTPAKYLKDSILLLEISPNNAQEISKEENLKWLKSNVSHIVSTEISGKYTKYDKDHNKKKIKEIRGNTTVVQILNKRISDIFEIYNILDEEKIPPEYKGFETISYDLNEIKEKMVKNGEEEASINNYLKIYKEKAECFVNDFENIKGRERKKKTKPKENYSKFV